MKKDCELASQTVPIQTDDRKKTEEPTKRKVYQAKLVTANQPQVEL